MKPLILSLSFLFFTLISSADAPKRFHFGGYAGALVPFVFSEGWYSFGANTGLYTDMRVHKSFAARVEVAYALNPGYIRPTVYPTWPEERRAQFQYVEVPVLLRWIPDFREKRFELSITGGATYARLLDYKVRAKAGFDLSPIVEMKSREAIVPFLGACFMVKRIGFEFRGLQPIDLQTGMTWAARINFQI